MHYTEAAINKAPNHQLHRFAAKDNFNIYTSQLTKAAMITRTRGSNFLSYRNCLVSNTFLAFRIAISFDCALKCMTNTDPPNSLSV